MKIEKLKSLRIEESKKNKKEYYCKNAIYHNTDYIIKYNILKNRIITDER